MAKNEFLVFTEAEDSSEGLVRVATCKKVLEVRYTTGCMT